ALRLRLAQMDRPHRADADRPALDLARPASAARAAGDGDRPGTRARAVGAHPAAGAAARPAGQWMADELGRRREGDLVRLPADARPRGPRPPSLRDFAHAAPLARLDADGRAGASPRRRGAPRPAAPRRNLPPHVAVHEVACAPSAVGPG